MKVRKTKRWKKYIKSSISKISVYFEEEKAHSVKLKDETEIFTVQLLKMLVQTGFVTVMLINLINYSSI